MFEFFIGVFVGVVVTVKVIQWAFTYYIARLKEELGIEDEPEEEAEEKDVVAQVEEHDGIFYVFAEADGRFLGQGSNFDELLDRLKLDHLLQDQVLDIQGPKEVIKRLKATRKK